MVNTKLVGHAADSRGNRRFFFFSENSEILRIFLGNLIKNVVVFLCFFLGSNTFFVFFHCFSMMW